MGKVPKDFKLGSKSKKLIKSALEQDSLGAMNEKRRDAFLDLIQYIKELEYKVSSENKK